MGAAAVENTSYCLRDTQCLRSNLGLTHASSADISLSENGRGSGSEGHCCALRFQGFKAVMSSQVLSSSRFKVRSSKCSKFKVH